MVHNLTEFVVPYLLWFGLPVLLAAPLIMLDRAGLVGWALWFVLAAFGLYSLYRAGPQFHNVNRVNLQLGSHLVWIALIALALRMSRRYWDRCAVLGIWPRLSACLALLLAPFARLPLLPTL